MGNGTGKEGEPRKKKSAMKKHKEENHETSPDKYSILQLQCSDQPKGFFDTESRK
jgi:hypothetical protein